MRAAIGRPYFCIFDVTEEILVGGDALIAPL